MSQAELQNAPQSFYFSVILRSTLKLEAISSSALNDTMSDDGGDGGGGFDYEDTGQVKLSNVTLHSLV